MCAPAVQDDLMDRFQSGLVDIGRLQKKTLKKRESEREIGGVLEDTQKLNHAACKHHAVVDLKQHQRAQLQLISRGLRYERLPCDLCLLMHASSRRSYGHVIDQAYTHRFFAMDATLRRLVTRKSPRCRLTGSLTPAKTLAWPWLVALQPKERGSSSIN